MTVESNQNHVYLHAKEQAYRYLDVRFHFEAELIEKLKKKGYEDSICVDVIEELRSKKLVNDYDLALRFAEDKLKKEGKNKVKYRLIQKGVHKDVISRVLDDIYVDEYQVCLELLSKKMESLEIQGGFDKKQEAKLVNFLKNKGFSTGNIIKCISLHKKG